MSLSKIIGFVSSLIFFFFFLVGAKVNANSDRHRAVSQKVKVENNKKRQQEGDLKWVGKM